MNGVTTETVGLGSSNPLERRLHRHGSTLYMFSQLQKRLGGVPGLLK